MKPLGTLVTKDPDDWFRAGGLVKLRALAAYPAVGLLAGAAVGALSELGFESLGWIGPLALVLPATLTWTDDELADAQPGERAAWSLARASCCSSGSCRWP